MKIISCMELAVSSGTSCSEGEKFAIAMVVLSFGLTNDLPEGLQNLLRNVIFRISRGGGSRISKIEGRRGVLVEVFEYY